MAGNYFTYNVHVTEDYEAYNYRDTLWGSSLKMPRNFLKHATLDVCKAITFSQTDLIFTIVIVYENVEVLKVKEKCRSQALLSFL